MSPLAQEKRMLMGMDSLGFSDRLPEDLEDWSEPEEEGRKSVPAQRAQHVQRP